MKYCPKCKTFKDVSCFGKRKDSKDGLSYSCKDCLNQENRKKLSDPVYIQYHKEYYQRNKAKLISQVKEYRRKPEIRERRKQERERYKDRHRQLYIEKYSQKRKLTYSTEDGKIKIKARNAVYSAIKRGVLPHQSTLQCVNCHNQAQEYHHHKGYTKEHWLDVIPVCRDCHEVYHLTSSTRPCDVAAQTFGPHSWL